MKRILLLSALFLSGLFAFAQTQQGYVKTKGRIVNGQIVHGQGLKGATVSIKGRTAVVVNKDDGSFSFPIPEKQFRVDSVRKKGYQMVDMDALSKTYRHSSNPIYLVMETPEQQLQDQLDSERKIRRTLTDQLRQREDEIEALKEQQKITDEEYRQALQKLYEETDQNEQLIKEMVERYSTIDYDQLSEFDQKISELILNGELVKADSMLRTKGDINQRAENYQRHKAINSKEKEELTRRQASLELSETAAQKELEDLANDCYRKFEIFKMQHLNDSAAYYLELRAGLDTTNVDWQKDVGIFFRQYIADYDKALGYFQLGVQQSQMQFGEKDLKTAEFYNEIGSLYDDTGDYGQSWEYLNKALVVRKTVFGENHPDVAASYNNIGHLYYQHADYEKALEYYGKALAIWESLLNDNYSTDMATCYYNIGMVYALLGDNNKSLEFSTQALTILESAYGEKHPDVAACYNSLGYVYYNNDDYANALEYHNKALAIWKSVYGEIHPTVGTSYNNIGFLYFNQGDSEKALEYYGKALCIGKAIFGENHPCVADYYHNIGSAHFQHGDQDKTLEYYGKALTIRKNVFGEIHPDVAISYNSLGFLHSKLGNYDKALEYYNNALAIRIAVFGEIHPDVGHCYNNIGFLFYKQDNYGKALEYFEKVLQIWEKTLGPDHQFTIMTKEKISEIQAKLKEQENEPKNEN